MKANKRTLDRRAFLKQAAPLTAFFIVPRFVLGGKGFTPPSDRIHLGFIGAGKQGFVLLKNFQDCHEALVVAVSDVYKAKMESFTQRVNAFYAGKTGTEKYTGCRAYGHFEEILERKDIDAVVISTPDHWHAVQAVMAAREGKDIYCEKPLSLTVYEGRCMVNATRTYNRVFQTGSMQRSWPEFRQAVELVRNGYIGELKTVQVSVGPPPVPFDLPKEPLVAGLDWNRWLGPNHFLHFNSALAPSLADTFWAKWRNYREFGGGFMTDWGAHMFDIAQWALNMDESGPTHITPPVEKGKGILTYRYANGLTMTHQDIGRKCVQFIGTEGTIDVERRKLVTTPVSLKDQVMSAKDKRVYYSDNHYKDWLTAIRNRSRPVCDVETGHRTATVCNIGNIALELGRPLQWDPVNEEFVNDAEANAMLKRPMKRKWAKHLVRAGK